MTESYNSFKYTRKKMNNKDIQKAVKSNGLHIYICFFSPLTSSYKKNQICQKMQREKLYKLHTIAYFILADFIFKMDRILSDKVLTILK